MKLNLSCYLVTDSTPPILKGRDLCAVVEEALKGGVTVVQYRDKKSDTGDQIHTAKKLHQITTKYGVPLLINDRVDVALAVGAEGVHLGQDDMTIEEAKRLLPKDAIIGISASSIDEAQKAIAAGADYLGIGTMFATPTKTNTKSIIGTAGTQAILDAISETGRDVGTVSIGGINLSNVQRVLYQSKAPRKGLDGVAIVSAIMAADDPRAAAAEFVRRIATPPPFVAGPAAPINGLSEMLDTVPAIVQKMVQTHPLVHNMINFVVANFVANVALSMGASPIMSPYGEEAVDLCQFDGALLINMGTLTSESVSNYLKAIKAYNERGNPVVYDPVGAAATHIRRGAVAQLMAGGYFTLIKGNEGEIRQVSGSSGVTQRGVDSGPSSLDSASKAKLARDLARREHNLVLLTGSTDYLSDGERVLAIENGHELLGQVTGTGCAVGTVAGCFLTTHPSDKLLAVLSGLLMYEIAAENAAARENVRGPGSFVPAFLDEFIPTTSKLLRAADTFQIPTYVTTQNRARLGDTIGELQRHLTGAHVKANLDKTLFSMITPELEALLPKPEVSPVDAIIVGIETHICVTQTALDLLERGHRVYVIVDGVTSVNPEERGIALARLRDAGAIVTSSESILFEILGDASHANFKAVNTLIKEFKEDTKASLGALAKM
ncbi:hypothetical protein ATERTT37_007795 [Aspergillus terreus]